MKTDIWKLQRNETDGALNQTMYRHLRQIGLYACRPVIFGPFAATHFRRRLSERKKSFYFPLWIFFDLRIKSRDDCSCLPSASRHALLAKDLVTWQAMVGRHILEDIVGRVVQYVDILMWATCPFISRWRELQL
ncbi:hypothetical protein TNCV_2144321 [Trichonephila clavipes]|nr:hypothetical protein TNCV_2144321 [Trichonephila clavipes]